MLEFASRFFGVRRNLRDRTPRSVAPMARGAGVSGQNYSRIVRAGSTGFYSGISPRQILVGNALQRHAGARCTSKAQLHTLVAVLANRAISRAQR
jgi:hypothetical protein